MAPPAASPFGIASQNAPATLATNRFIYSVSASHIDGPGVEWLIETIAPKRILPVHSQKLNWFAKR